MKKIKQATALAAAAAASVVLLSGCAAPKARAPMTARARR